MFMGELLLVVMFLGVEVKMGFIVTRGEIEVIVIVMGS